jgi:hypothetical protein
LNITLVPAWQSRNQEKNGYHHEAHEEHEKRIFLRFDAFSDLRVLRDLCGEKVLSSKIRPNRPSLKKRASCENF